MFDHPAALAAMISVVIPTLNEAEALPALLTALQNECAPHETVIVDGGSRDATVDLARAGGARVFQAPTGRGSQLCAGARGCGRLDVPVFA